MDHIPHCPNPRCPSNNPENPPEASFRKKGFEYNKKLGKIQRYQCKHCWVTFNINVFTIDYYTSRKISYKKLMDCLISASGIRDMARQFRCSPKTVLNRIGRLAQKAMALIAPVIKEMNLREDLTADGLESFILSQFFPTNINILAGRDSQFLYFFNAFHFKRKGRMNQAQKEQAKTLYQEAQFEKRAPSNSFRELLDHVADLLDHSSLDSLTLDTDENPIYRYQYSRHERMEKVIHRKTNSKEERNRQNKLFSCNYIDRQVRKYMAEHVRETVQFGRNMNNSMSRFTLYSFWHNFKKPFRINSADSVFKRHGEAAGLELKKVKQLWKSLLDDRRYFRFKLEDQLNPFQQRLWGRRLLNPLNRGMV